MYYCSVNCCFPLLLLHNSKHTDGVENFQAEYTGLYPSILACIGQLKGSAGEVTVAVSSRSIIDTVPLASSTLNSV